jgi:hypothetical protein
VNFRLLLCIAMGVFVAHIGLFMLLRELRPKLKPLPPLKSNFSAKATVVVNTETGEKTVYREITVSTKFADAPSTPAPARPLPAEIKPVETAEVRE